MAVLKCKMCGGDVAFSPNDTVGICEWCGSKSTLPKISDDRLANLFNRANHFRMKGDFDKAEASYEHILEEDNSIAEAHWGAVISRYGIEYVEDPNSHKRVPTCHRASWRSILTDNDYLSAIEYAEENAKAIYVAEAKYIDDVQKRILAISKNEAPYDIFICYKESTGGGSRTKDSVMAQDLYERLQKEGFRVFFARITLEDKLGQEYEPYIFSALNSAKVMLVIGTDADNFNAPWVKNEWSRFIAIMHEQMGRLLIPCYKGMDVYELPEELSVFQCQDMGKIGFEQDLIRGIKKVLRPEGEAEQINRSPEAGSNSLLKRGNMFLADCEWEKASEYFDRVLDIDPECAEAYSGKLCATLQASAIGVLGKIYIGTVEDRFVAWAGNVSASLTEFPDYNKAMQFADSDLKRALIDEERLVQREVQELQIVQNQSEISITEKGVKVLQGAINVSIENIKNGEQQIKSLKRNKESNGKQLMPLINECKREERTSNVICILCIGIPVAMSLIEFITSPKSFLNVVVGIFFALPLSGYLGSFLGGLLSRPSANKAKNLNERISTLHANDHAFTNQIAGLEQMISIEKSNISKNKERVSIEQKRLEQLSEKLNQNNIRIE